MREILFRGKRVDNGEWVEGDLLHGYCKGNNEPCIASEEKQCTFEVIPETIGQYTGLTDKQGKKIFEGDILNVHDALIRCDEKYHEFVGCISFGNASYRIDGDDRMTHYRWLDYEVEVIGNIHDNPELLEVQPCTTN